MRIRVFILLQELHNTPIFLMSWKIRVSNLSYEWLNKKTIKQE